LSSLADLHVVPSVDDARSEVAVMDDDRPSVIWGTTIATSGADNLVQPATPFCAHGTSSTAPPTKRRKTATSTHRPSEVIAGEIDKALLTALTMPPHKPNELDEEDHFGCFVAKVLRRLPPAVRANTKLKMHQLLVQAEFPQPLDQAEFPETSSVGTLLYTLTQDRNPSTDLISG